MFLDFVICVLCFKNGQDFLGRAQALKYIPWLSWGLEHTEETWLVQM